MVKFISEVSGRLLVSGLIEGGDLLGTSGSFCHGRTGVVPDELINEVRECKLFLGLLAGAWRCRDRLAPTTQVTHDISPS